MQQLDSKKLALILGSLLLVAVTVVILSRRDPSLGIGGSLGAGSDVVEVDSAHQDSSSIAGDRGDGRRTNTLGNLSSGDERGNPDSDSKRNSTDAPDIAAGDRQTTTSLEGSEGMNGLAQSIDSLNPDGTKKTTSEGNPSSGFLVGSEGGSASGISEAPEDATEEAVVIGGKVFRDVEPVEGARVQLVSDETNAQRIVLTTVEGTYRYEGVNPGSYRLILMSPKSPDNQRTILVEANVDRLSEDFVIPATEKATGIVVDAKSQEGVPGVKLQVWRGDEVKGTVYTTSDGTFELVPLDVGSYRLKGFVAGYVENSTSFTVEKSGTTSPIRLLLEPTGLLRGRVVSPQGVGVMNARVSLFGASAYKDPYAELGVVYTLSDGVFTFSLPPEKFATTGFRIGAWATGYLPAYSEYLNQESFDSSVDYEIRLGEGGRVTGLLVAEEGEDGAPLAIPGAEVTMVTGYPNTGAIYTRVGVPLPSTTSSDDGVFTLGPIEPGSTQIRILAAGFVPKDETWVASDGEDKDLGTIILESDADTKEGRIFGVIVDDQGKPLVNHAVMARHSVSRRDHSTRTDSQGGFLFDELPEGQYMLATNGSALRGSQYITMDQTYPFAETGGEKVFIIYDMSHSVRLQVVDAGGSAVPNYKVGITVRDNGRQGFGGARETFGLGLEKNVQSPNGDTVINDLISGTVTMIVTSDQYGSAEVSGGVIPVGGQLDLGQVQLSGGHQITGALVSADTGVAVSGALLKLYPPDGAPSDHPLRSLQFRTYSDESGKFTFNGVTAKTFDLLIESKGYVEGRLRNQPVSSGEQTNLGDIPMAGASVFSGKVVGPDGSPIFDVRFVAGEATFFSDREGNFFSNAIPPGEVSIHLLESTGQLMPETNPITVTVPAEGLFGFLITLRSRDESTI